MKQMQIIILLKIQDCSQQMAHTLVCAPITYTSTRHWMTLMAGMDWWYIWIILTLLNVLRKQIFRQGIYHLLVIILTVTLRYLPKLRIRQMVCFHISNFLCFSLKAYFMIFKYVGSDPPSNAFTCFSAYVGTTTAAYHNEIAICFSMSNISQIHFGYWVGYDGDVEHLVIKDLGFDASQSYHKVRIYLHLRTSLCKFGSAVLVRFPMAAWSHYLAHGW